MEIVNPLSGTQNLFQAADAVALAVGDGQPQHLINQWAVRKEDGEQLIHELVGHQSHRAAVSPEVPAVVLQRLAHAAQDDPLSVGEPLVGRPLPKGVHRPADIQSAVKAEFFQVLIALADHIPVRGRAVPLEDGGEDGVLLDGVEQLAGEVGDDAGNLLPLEVGDMGVGAGEDHGQVAGRPGGLELIQRPHEACFPYNA